MINTLVRILRAALLLLAGGCVLYLLWLPYVPRLKKHNPQTTAVIERRIRQAREKGKTLKPKMVWKSIDEISPYLFTAVLLAEDDTFYSHHGFDFDQIAIAVKINWKRRRFAYGGSTITQQLARTLYLSPSKNLLRKGKEAIIAFWMERTLTKKRIMELYLNTAEWGNGIFGIEAASWHYYGKSASELGPEESVALASILPSPRKWSPFRVTAFMQKRRGNLLKRLMGKEYFQKNLEKEEDRALTSDEVLKDEEEEEAVPVEAIPETPALPPATTSPN